MSFHFPNILIGREIEEALSQTIGDYTELANDKHKATLRKSVE